MEHSQNVHPEDVIQSRVMDAQRLAATENYPEYTFSLEFDNLLLEEVYRCKIHRTCDASQLESFEILLDNFLGTKKLGLTEFSALHGGYLKHQDYPTVLHLQHRYVTLLQSHEHHQSWIPKSPEVAALLLRRDKFLRLLKQQLQKSNIQVALYDPNKPRSEDKPEDKSEAKSPVAVNAVRVRGRGAPKLGRKPLKDKSFYVKKRGELKLPTPRKSLPRRKTRKDVSYAEEVMVELDFPQREPVKQRPKPHPQQSPARSANHANLAYRKSVDASSSSPFPLLLGDSQAFKPNNRHGISPTSPPHLPPSRLSGITKPSSQTHLTPLAKHFPMSAQRDVLSTPVDSPRFRPNQMAAKEPIDVDDPVNTQGFVHGEDVKVELAIHSPPETPQSTEARINEMVQKLVNMEASLTSWNRNVENAMGNIQGRMHVFEQVVQMNMASMQTGLRTDMETIRLEMRKMHSDKRRGRENVGSGMETVNDGHCGSDVGDSSATPNAEHADAKDRVPTFSTFLTSFPTRIRNVLFPGL